MDQISIGKFIAERRKANGFTQMQLAEKLGITYRILLFYHLVGINFFFKTLKCLLKDLFQVFGGYFLSEYYYSTLILLTKSVHNLLFYLPNIDDVLF